MTSNMKEIVDRINSHFYSNNSSPTILNSSCSYHENKGLNEYILDVNLDINDTKPPEFVFIIDVSGSMGRYANYFISKTIPAVLEGLHYEKDKKIHLITFNSDVTYYNVNSRELEQSPIQANGGTEMRRAIDVLDKILEVCQNYSNQLRILVLSDGFLHDQEETKSKGDYLYQKYKNMFKINSQAVRLITSSNGDPETEGIVSLLKLNNVKNNTYLVEFNAQNIENLANAIIPLFIDDNLSGYQFKIKSNMTNLKSYPWEKYNFNELPVQKGKNIIFSNSKSQLKLADITIICKDGEKVDSDNYEAILGVEKIRNILSKIKMNKVLNTPESLKENSIICDYFNNILEKKIDKGEGDSIQFLVNVVNSTNNSNILNFNNQQKANFIQNPTDSYIHYRMNKMLNIDKKHEKQIKELTETNSALLKELTQLKKEIDELKKDREKLKEIDALKNDQGKLNQKIIEIEDRLNPREENKLKPKDLELRPDSEKLHESTETSEAIITELKNDSDSNNNMSKSD